MPAGFWNEKLTIHNCTTKLLGFCGPPEHLNFDICIVFKFLKILQASRLAKGRPQGTEGAWAACKLTHQLFNFQVFSRIQFVLWSYYYQRKTEKSRACLWGWFLCRSLILIFEIIFKMFIPEVVIAFRTVLDPVSSKGSRPDIPTTSIGFGQPLYSQVCHSGTQSLALRCWHYLHLARRHGSLRRREQKANAMVAWRAAVWVSAFKQQWMAMVGWHSAPGDHLFEGKQFACRWREIEICGNLYLWPSMTYGPMNTIEYYDSEAPTQLHPSNIWGQDHRAATPVDARVFARVAWHAWQGRELLRSLFLKGAFVILSLKYQIWLDSDIPWDIPNEMNRSIEIQCAKPGFRDGPGPAASQPSSTLRLAWHRHLKRISKELVATVSQLWLLIRLMVGNISTTSKVQFVVSYNHDNQRSICQEVNF